MRRILFLLVLLIAFCSCQEIQPGSDGYKSTQLTETGVASEVTEVSAILSGYANPTSDLGTVIMGVLYSTDNFVSADNSIRVTANELDKNNMYKVYVTSLIPGTDYFYKSFIEYNGIVRSGDVKSFKTKELNVSLLLNDAIDVGSNRATITGVVNTNSSVVEIDKTRLLFSNTVNTIEDFKGYVPERPITINEDGGFSYNLNNLQKNTPVYYVICASVLGDEIYSEIKSFKTQNDYKYTAEAIDLGLSVKWSNIDLGAFFLDDGGACFSWGETETKERYWYDTYIWGNGHEFYKPQKYNEDDNILVLEQEDDAAYVKLGGKWRIPSSDEWRELFTKSKVEKFIEDDFKGCIITGPNGNSIRIRAYGDSHNLYSGEIDCYWSSSGIPHHYYGNDMGDIPRAYCYYFDYYTGKFVENKRGRVSGCAIRPVLD